MLIIYDPKADEMEEKMRITGLKSICCGENIKERNKYANVKTPKEWGDEIYVCHRCRKPCEGYFTALIERELGK